MTVRSRVADLVGLHLDKEPLCPRSDLTLYLTDVRDDAAFFDVRRCGDTQTLGRVVVPVVTTTNCETIDQEMRNGRSQSEEG